MTDKWAEYKKRFCGCKDASRLNSCRGLQNCELSEDSAERKRAQAQAAPEAEPVAVVCITQSDCNVTWTATKELTPAGTALMSVRQHNRIMASAPQHDAELAELKAILPELDDALESLEVHGRHSDQGYRELKDWYRKIAGITARIDAKLATLRHV